MLQADPQVVLGVRTPSMLSARPAVRGEWICVRLGTLNALGSGDPLWCGVGAPENRRRQRQQDSWCEQPYCPTIRIGLMTRRSIERDCAKSLPDAEPDSIRLNNPGFSGQRSVRQRHCQEAASLVCPYGDAPAIDAAVIPVPPPVVCLSPRPARPRLRGNSSPHCLQHQKPNPFPSHDLPHSYFRLHPLPML